MSNVLKKTNLIFLAILFIAALLRFWQLGNIPTGLTNDEATYIYNAYSIWQTHKDITGKVFPVSINVDNSFSPVPIYFIAPVVGMLGLSPFTGRLLFALAGIGTVIVVYLLAKRLFNNNFIALSSMFVLAVSPWHIHFSRTAYDGVLALFFITFGIYIFLRNIEKGNIYFSLPFFLLGFYSYHATKIFFVFFISLLLFIFWKELRAHKKSLGIFLIGIVTILFSFFWIQKTQQISRGEVLLQYNSQEAATTVNNERRTNSAPVLLKQLFSNKALYMLRVIRENYLEAFSPQFLFLYGETSGLYGIYGPSERGEMYLLELPLLILGLLYLLNQKNKKVSSLLILGFLLTPLPSAFTVDKSYAMRSIMMLPFLSIFVGCGMYDLYTKWKEHRFFKGGLILFILLYGFFIASYLYQYYFRYSIYGAEAWERSSRDLIAYVQQEKQQYKTVQIVNPGDLVIQYAIFGNTNPDVMQRAYRSRSPKQVDTNVFLVDGCIDTHGKIFDPKLNLPPSTLYIVPDMCFPQSQPDDTITQVGDIRTIWKMYKNP